MDSLAALQQQFDDAYARFREGQYQAAMLLWAQARQHALNLGERGLAFRYGYWELDMLSRLNPRQARLRLFSLLCEAPADAPVQELWYVRVRLCALQMQLRPERAAVERQLTELEEHARRVPVSKHDLLLYRGFWADCRGDWIGAQGHYALAWEAHQSPGFAAYAIAWPAAYSCLRLGRWAEAHGWLDRLRLCADRHDARIGRWEMTLACALHAADAAAVREALEAGVVRNHWELRARLYLRGESRDPLDDPADHAHPARRLARPAREQRLDRRYEALRAVVDYRLGCLRYTAGLPAVDDLFYQQDRVTHPPVDVDRERLTAQLRGFRVSWHQLRRLAAYLDALVESAWRRGEGRARWERAAAIADACGVCLEPAAVI
ncbi:MAG: hypothetical protein MUE46_09640 [Xanthomonadales bacterium]|jgi:hypothetical protein|nr:hypothetical protein [Xanthomonadales bacterium]